MRKYNFILTEYNWKQFVAIFDKMLNKYGALKSQSIYTGAKYLNKYLEHYTNQV